MDVYYIVIILRRLNKDFTNKRIGIIGSGATAVQLLPKLVHSDARRVTLFQRTPNYVIEKGNCKYGSV